MTDDWLPGMVAGYPRAADRAGEARRIVDDYQRLSYDTERHAQIRWFGHEMWKEATDVLVYAELVNDLRPAVIVECLPGATLVNVPPGSLVAATRRTYSGPMMQITTAGGYQLTATPNHPILTRRGWTPIGELNEGSDFVCGGIGQRMGHGHPHVNYVPTPIGQIFDSLKGHVVERRPLHPVDFHVDRPNGEVEIVWSGRSLHRDPVSPFFKPGRQFQLADTDLASGTLPRGGPPREHAVGCGRAARRGVHPVHANSQSAAGTVAFVSQDVRLRSGPQRVASSHHCVSDPGCRDAEVLGDSRRAFTRDVATDGFVGGEGGGGSQDAAVAGLQRYLSGRDAQVGSDGGRGFPGDIAAERLISVERWPAWTGHVYNLQTTSGMYEAAGIIVHNCGTFRGGSALFFAHMCDLAGHGEVVTVDTKDWGTEARPLPDHPRITYLVDPAGSTAAHVVDTVRALVDGQAPVLVILDSDHTMPHVLAEMEAYAPMVTSGSLLIVEDTNLGGRPVLPGWGPGPAEAVAAFLETHHEFHVHYEYERLLVTAAPGGFLLRV